MIGPTEIGGGTAARTSSANRPAGPGPLGRLLEVEIPEEGDLPGPPAEPPVKVPVEAAEAEPARFVEPADRDVVALRLGPDPRQPPLDRPGVGPVDQCTTDSGTSGVVRPRRCARPTP